MTTRKLDATRLSGKAESLSLTFSHRIIGQPKATQALTEVLEKFQSGFYDTGKPIASLLFLGPTGVGKTGTVEAFAEGLHVQPNMFMKIDCGEYQHSHEIAKLVGSPPGYLGHRETHPFFTNVRVQGYRTTSVPFTVILFDEIEKANDSLWNLLLGILDKGQLTLGTNEVVDLTQTVIIMTSNVGAGELAAKAGDNPFGFSHGGGASSEDMEATALSAARRKFMPEFMNRLDRVVVFNTLTPENLTEILELELEKIRGRVILNSRSLFNIIVSPSAKKQLLKEGYDKKYNARNLKRVIERYVSNPLASLLATGQIMPLDDVIVDYDGLGEWSYYAEAKIGGQPPQGDLFS